MYIAKEALSRALQTQGWQLYDSPWAGVATRDAFIVVVDVAPNSVVHRRSGVGRPVRGLLGTALCPYCEGTGRIDGEEECENCNGGLTYASTWATRTNDWPTFMANPPKKQWHVERSAKIVASGRGLAAIERIVTPGIQDVKAQQLVHKMESKLGYCECPVCQRGIVHPIDYSARTEGFCWSCKGKGNLLLSEV